MQREDRHFLFSCIATLLACAFVWGLYALLGHALIEAVATASGMPEARIGAIRKSADDWIRALPIFLVIGFGIAGLLHARKRLQLGALSFGLLFLVFYLAVEFLLAPRLVRVLDLDHYDLVRDPDHRPTFRGEHWNSDLLSQTREPHEYRPEDFNILFLGDSFTMGLFLEAQHENAFPHQVERLLRAELPDHEVRTANFGWVSSSPLLSLRRLEEIGARYHPDLVVMVVDMTDPHDDIKYQNLFERRGLTKLYDRLPLMMKLLQLQPTLYTALYNWTTGGNLPSLRYFHSEQPLEDSREFLQPIEANLARLHDAATRLGADFVTFVFPRNYQHSDRESPDNWELDAASGYYTVLGPYSLEPFRYFAELNERTSYPIYSLLADFQNAEEFPLCHEADAHWTLAGHEVAARGIATKLLDRIRATHSDRSVR